MNSTKAIVLRCAPFKEAQRILSIFSQDRGISSLLLKRISSRSGHLVFTQPFCEADFLFSQRNSDLLIFQEGTMLDLHLPLRNNLHHMQTATSLIQAILRSQLPGKASPLLYQLLSSFLKKIPETPCQNSLLACFYLKLLKHEGLYSLDDAFSNEDRQILHSLANMQKFQELQDRTLSCDLCKKVESFVFSRLE